MLGIHMADFVLSQLKWRKYDFISNAFKSKINYAFLFSASLLIILISLIDLNFFFLKFVLWIPTTHWICHVRTYMFALLSGPASMEMSKWASSKRRTRFFSQCPSAVIGMIALVSEIILVVRFRGNLFASSPTTPLGTILLVVTTVYLAVYSFAKISRRTKP
jgi:phosphatidylserine synthase 2